MSIAAFGIGAGLFALGGKELWAPKTQRLTVGRDVAPMSATAFAGERRTLVAAGADDMRFTTSEVYGLAKSVAQGGARVKHFRTVDTRAITFSSQPAPANDAEATRLRNMGELTASVPLMETKDKLVTFADGMLQVWRKEKGGSASLMAEQQVANDTRLVWDSEGNPEFLSGASALTDGKLLATSDNEVLIRLSGAAVEAGTGTTVLNMSAEAGTFSRGHNVTYLGSYTGSTITGGKGETTYAGYFENALITAAEGKGVFAGVFESMRIEAGDAMNVFSGYFSASSVQGGNGKNSFGGMFLNSSTLNGGKDDDSFSGKFIDSTVNGGEGANTFGSAVNRASTRQMVTRMGQAYTGLEADFVNATVTGGSGKDTYQGVSNGGSVTLGDGDDRASGVFTETRVNTGAGNDTVTAMYALMTSVDTGNGTDSVDLATAFASTVRTGEGTASVTLGRNRDESSDNAIGTLWQTADEHLRRAAPKNFGELGGNTVDATAGENLVTIHTGSGERTVRTGTTEPAPSQDVAETPQKNTAEADLPPSDTPAAKGNDTLTLARAIDEGQTNLALIAGDLGLRPSPTALPSPASDIRQKTAARRYARLGGETRETGSVGATIHTGTGEDIRIRTYDSVFSPSKPGETGMHRITSRSAGAGRYEWVQSLT